VAEKKVLRFNDSIDIFLLEMIDACQKRIQDGADGHNFERGPSKDHFSKVWLRLAQ
jgi:hypothetical protein